jgi:hypothetical protein
MRRAEHAAAQKTSQEAKEQYGVLDAVVDQAANAAIDAVVEAVGNLVPD